MLEKIGALVKLLVRLLTTIELKVTPDKIGQTRPPEPPAYDRKIGSPRTEKKKEEGFIFSRGIFERETMNPGFHALGKMRNLCGTDESS